MKEEIQAVIQAHLENYVREILNDKFKSRTVPGSFAMPNPDLKYELGWLNAACMCLNLSYSKEGDFWVVRNGRRTIIAKVKEEWED